MTNMIVMMDLIHVSDEYELSVNYESNHYTKRLSKYNIIIYMYIVFISIY